MTVLLRPWFAVMVLLVTAAVWAFTLGPWGQRRGERAPISTRLELRGDTYKSETATSAPFDLSGNPLTLRITGAPSQRSSLIATVEWRLIPGRPSAEPPIGGSQGFMNDQLDTGTLSLAEEYGTIPRGTYRMRVSAVGSTAATITVTVAEPSRRGYPQAAAVIGVVVVVGVAYIGLSVFLLRRRFQPNPLVNVQRRDSQ